MNAGYLKILPCSPLVELAHSFERDTGRFDDLRSRPGMLEDALVNEAPGPNHHVGPGDELGAPNRQQVWRPRPRPNEPDLAQNALL
jgi:hypothetical protein